MVCALGNSWAGLLTWDLAADEVLNAFPLSKENATALITNTAETRAEAPDQCQ